MPLWRNGRRDRLKICYLHGCAGSSPARGTNIVYMKYYLLVIILTLKIQTCWAKDQLHGFSTSNEPVKPVCIHNIFPALSEKNFIIKPIILEDCQKSNLGFHSDKIQVSDNVVSAKTSAEIVQYQVIGKTTDNIFIIFFKGNIAAYEIKKELIKTNLLGDHKETKHILSVIGYSFVPCFKKGKI